MRALDDHKCILLEAETGSGKTTQVPQWCMEWWKKRHPHTQSMVCCTQPRRLATVSVAERVAKELDVPLGNVVGYSIRFEEVVDSGTLLKYCTDGVLLAESSRDEMLMRYGVILLDEVHERTMITDVVMGLVKRIMELRPDLRVVVMSATLKTGKFADYFSTHYSMQISGRSFSVKINFSDWDIIMDPEEYVKKSVEKAIEIHKKTNKRDDDILLFLSGQDEVESACELLDKEADKCKESGELKVLPLFGSMQNEHLQMLEDTRQKDKENASRKFTIDRQNIREWQKQKQKLISLRESKSGKRLRLDGAGRHLRDKENDFQSKPFYEAWEGIPKENISKSFKTCGITNAFDGSEDGEIHYFKEDGPVPNGMLRLQQAREMAEFDFLAEGIAGLFEEVDVEQDEENGFVNYRRCIVATNVAETSMTIDGIVFVIDPGFCKRKIYNPRTKLESLAVQRISRASAVQRAGRAGRTRPGICFRLYTEHCYDKIMKEIVPEIKHTNLGSVVLRLKKSGINDIYGFDLIDKPPPEQIQHALHMLTELGALDAGGYVTPLGEKINSLPVDPPLARMLIESAKLCCSEEVISICAMLSAPNRCFCRPRKKQIEADRAKAKFVDDVGDHLTLLRVYNAFVDIQTKDKRKWCFENYLNYRTLQYAQDVRNQLANVMLQRLNLMPVGLDACSPLYPHNILKALLAGSFMKLAFFCPNASGLQRNAQSGCYMTVESHINMTRNKDDPVEPYFLHGSSVLFKGAKEYSSKPEWVLFNEAMQHNNKSNNQRCFLQTVSKIRPEWLAELAPAYRRQISLKSTALDEILNAHEKANKTSAAQNLRENGLSALTQLLRGISLRKS
uniref:RNA helicase n=1 Tax=Globodera rostochiensis TaxID=31243 RepID=A0A914I290_GLORO